MPKDKTATHHKLTECMRKEFLEKGYEKASLNNIARMTGITPAAVYRHFGSKEEMFISIVKPAADAFENCCRDFVSGMTEEIDSKHRFENYRPYDMNWFRAIINIIYDYYDEFILLISGSAGTIYENFADSLVRMEENSTNSMLAHLDESNIKHTEVPQQQVHIISSAYIKALFQIICQKSPREEAVEQFAFIYRFFGEAWKAYINIGSLF